MVTTRRMDIDVFERELNEALKYVESEILNDDREHELEYYEGMRDGIRVAIELVKNLAHELN